MKNYLLKLFIVLFVFASASCSTGPSTGVGTGTANVETGAVDVAVDRTFTVTFSAPVDTSTVTTSSFFVVPDARTRAYDETLCDVSHAIDATVECTSATECVLIPTAELDPEAHFALCLTSDIQFENPTYFGVFEGLTETFVTAAEPVVASTYSVGGTVSGLVGTVILQNNSGDDLSITTEGNFLFATELAEGAAYTVTVLTQPTDQTCTVTDGSGTVLFTDVSNVTVTCVSDEPEPEPEPEADTTAPTVASTVPTDAVDGVSIDSTVSITFSEAMDLDTLTTNTTNTTCSGSLQVSSDNFVTCVRMAAAPVASNGDKTFTVTPNANLVYTTTYKIRITTSVQDAAGNSLASAHTTTTGFTTEDAPPLYMFDNGSDLQAQAFGSRATAEARCEATAATTYSSLGCTNVNALLCYSCVDDVASLLDNYDFTDTVIKGPTGVQIGNNWADLLDGSTDATFQAADSTDTLLVRVGCADNGTLYMEGDVSGNCNDWSDNTDGSAYTQTNFDWIGLQVGWGLNNCNSDTRYFCVCQ